MPPTSTSQDPEPLALAGGKPVRTKPWPGWPRAHESTLRLLAEVLQSGRWTVRGAWTGRECQEQILARRFAEWNGAQYCVPASSGSSALELALEALDIGCGDEVVLPVLGWIATAAAVLRVNAVPVFVDVDRETSCLSISAVRQAVSPRTRAIVAVHLHDAMVDMDPLLQFAHAHTIPVIEDCAQAPGARYGGRNAGTLGSLGCFSFNQEKPLTCGEGGAVITNDRELWNRLAALRADGHRFLPERRIVGEEQFEGPADVMGANHALSEFNAAVVLAQLPMLEPELEQRDANATLLDRGLGRLGWLAALRNPAGVTRRSVYEYGVLVDRSVVQRIALADLARAIAAELALPVHETDLPLHRNPLFSPSKNRRYANTRVVWADSGYPAADEIHQRLLVLPHWCLLGDRADVEDIVRAFEKVAHAWRVV